MNSRPKVNFRRLAAQAEALLSGQTNRISNAANLSALLFQELPEVNWAGFYFLEGEELLLGPFQGQPACVQIPMGHGVCGTAAASGHVQRVANVHEFEGHIACDANSVSELVIPLLKDGQLVGVLDIDSPRANRFSREDETGLVGIAQIYLQSII
jgi:GAF domain-containing protein